MNMFKKLWQSFKFVDWGLKFGPFRNEDGSLWLDKKGNPDYWYYISWPNPLSKYCKCGREDKHSLRYWGYGWMQYDCQVHEHFGFWFFNISWSLPWSYRKLNKTD